MTHSSMTVVEVNSMIRQQLRAAVEATDSAFRKALEDAYTAGWNAALGANFDPDPKGYVDALITRLTQEA